MGLLFDEYRLLQEKIDKIGGFRVTIKSWAVTVTAGVLVVIAGGKIASVVIGAFAIDLLLFFFFRFERKQTMLEWAFNKRARQIEIQFDRKRRIAGKPITFSSPNIARSLFGSRKKRREPISLTFKHRKLERFRRKLNSEVRLALSADILFYLTLGLAAWGPKLAGLVSDNSPPQINIRNEIQLPAQPVPAPSQLTPLKPNASDGPSFRSKAIGKRNSQ